LRGPPDWSREAIVVLVLRREHPAFEGVVMPPPIPRRH